MTPATRAARYQALRKVAPYTANPEAQSLVDEMAGPAPVVIDICRAVHVPAHGRNVVLFGDRQAARLPDELEVDSRPGKRQSLNVEEAMVAAIGAAHAGRPVVFQQPEMTAAQRRLRAKGER